MLWHTVPLITVVNYFREIVRQQQEGWLLLRCKQGTLPQMKRILLKQQQQQQMTLFQLSSSWSWWFSPTYRLACSEPTIGIGHIIIIIIITIIYHMVFEAEVKKMITLQCHWQTSQTALCHWHLWELTMNCIHEKIRCNYPSEKCSS